MSPFPKIRVNSPGAEDAGGGAAGGAGFCGAPAGGGGKTGSDAGACESGD